jgi:hypothetical protein
VELFSALRPANSTTKAGLAPFVNSRYVLHAPFRVAGSGHAQHGSGAKLRSGAYFEAA